MTIRQSDSVRCSYFVSNNGSFRKLPPGYEFPTMGLTSLICMWFCGDKSKNICPYARLTAYDCETADPKDATSKRRKDKLSKMKQTMKIVTEAAKRDGFSMNRRMSEWTVRDTNALSAAVDKYFRYPTKSHRRRKSEILWKTILNLYRKHGNKFSTELGNDA